MKGFKREYFFLFLLLCSTMKQWQWTSKLTDNKVNQDYSIVYKSANRIISGKNFWDTAGKSPRVILKWNTVRKCIP